MTASVAIRGLSKTFGTGANVVDALRDATVTIRAGGTTSVVGPSGAGKSTLLNLLGLLDSPTGGEYILGGQPTHDLSENERSAVRAESIGFVFQAFHLLRYLPAVENVELGMLYCGHPKRVRHRAALDALERVGLGHRARATPDTLSGGERQRVAVARAIAGNKQLLLCDEPTGNLDTVTSRQVMDTIISLSDEGKATVIVITHDRGVAARCVRRLELVDGVLGEAPQ